MSQEIRIEDVPSVEEKLSTPLDPKRIKAAPGGYGSYLEGWDVIAEANHVFGFDGWSFEIQQLDIMGEPPLLVSTRVRLTVKDWRSEAGAFTSPIVREDIGTNVPSWRGGEEPPTPEAMETAIKGAVTDGLKRAFRTFGAQFGNELYDKGQHTEPSPNEARPFQSRTQTDPGELCEHGITASQRDAWWSKAEEVGREVSACQCCGGPGPLGEEVCQKCVTR